MITKGIRGAITVNENSESAIREAVLELFTNLVNENSLEEKFVSHIIFTMTDDLDSVYPAKFIRKDFAWNKTALMCFPELKIQNSLPMCIRVLIVYNCEDSFIPRYVYLRDAADLRSK